MKCVNEDGCITLIRYSFIDWSDYLIHVQYYDVHVIHNINLYKNKNVM